MFILFNKHQLEFKQPIFVESANIILKYGRRDLTSIMTKVSSFIVQIVC